jgi:hypothetical protein
MRGNFKVKFTSTRKPGFLGQPGQAGNMDRQPWGLIVDEIARRGIEEVERVRHDDAEPANKKQLTHAETLDLWKAVERKRNSN